MTYEELIRLSYTGDPIAREDRPPFLTDDGLIFPGIDEGGDGDYADELRIKIEPDGFTMSYRTPGSDEPWNDDGWYATYEELVAAVYES